MNIKVEINQEKEPESLLPLAHNAEIEQIVHGIVDGINEQFGTVFRAHMPLDLQKMILDTFRKPKADEQVKVMKVDDIVAILLEKYPAFTSSYNTNQEVGNMLKYLKFDRRRINTGSAYMVVKRGNDTKKKAQSSDDAANPLVAALLGGLSKNS